VAARVLPGGTAMREKLLPSISKLLLSKFPVSRGGDEDELATLQALMVLYVYRKKVGSLGLPHPTPLFHTFMYSISFRDLPKTPLMTPCAPETTFNKILLNP
jgi:hypothetical protein